MLYCLKMDEMAEFFGKEIGELKKLPYGRLEAMEEEMRQKKAEEEALRNEQDQAFIGMMKKFFTPFQYLCQYFDEADVIVAVCKHGSERSLVDEVPVKAGTKYWNPKAEFKETAWATVPRYTKQGEQLMEGERKYCDIYLAPAQYQGLIHGDVVLELLYKKHPELKEFGYSAYEISDYENEKYEIYPKNHVYTPFHALMTKDIGAIVKRNEDYAKFYRNGIHTPEETKKRLASDEVQHYFDTIRAM